MTADAAAAAAAASDEAMKASERVRAGLDANGGELGRAAHAPLCTTSGVRWRAKTAIRCAKPVSPCVRAERRSACCALRVARTALSRAGGLRMQEPLSSWATQQSTALTLRIWVCDARASGRAALNIRPLWVRHRHWQRRRAPPPRQVA